MFLDWVDGVTAMESEITLGAQTRAKEFEYRVGAMKKLGKAKESDGVMAVLEVWSCFDGGGVVAWKAGYHTSGWSL